MYVLLFFACSFLGWCMEVTCKLVQFGRFINRGFLLGPLCPIYGTGAVLMAYFLPLWTTQVESTFLLALVLCGTLEYITSWLMEKLFHARWWDYSQKRFNINGRVYLNGFLAFGAGATCIKLVVQPWMSDIVRSWPIWLLHAVAGLSFVVVVIDAAITQAGLRSLDSRLAKVSEGIKALKSQQIRQIDTRISEADEQWRETSAKLRGQAEQAYDRFAAGAQQGIRAASRPVADAGELVRRSLNRQQRRLIRTFPKMVSLRDLTITDMIRDLWNRL